MDISSIFYFSKLTSINTHYSSLWDTLKMMLFTKYLIKWKCIGRISENFGIVWFRILYKITCKYENIWYACPVPLFTFMLLIITFVTYMYLFRALLSRRAWLAGDNMKTLPNNLRWDQVSKYFELSLEMLGAGFNAEQNLLHMFGNM